MSELFNEGDLDNPDEAPMWRTKDGKLLRLSEMTDQHLTNAIKYLERAAAEAKAVPPPAFNGEMAQLFADLEYERFMKADVSDLFPIYEDLVEEACRRTRLGEENANP